MLSVNSLAWCVGLVIVAQKSVKWGPSIPLLYSMNSWYSCFTVYPECRAGQLAMLSEATPHKISPNSPSSLTLQSSHPRPAFSISCRYQKESIYDLRDIVTRYHLFMKMAINRMCLFNASATLQVAIQRPTYPLGQHTFCRLTIWVTLYDIALNTFPT